MSNGNDYWSTTKLRQPQAGATPPANASGSTRPPVVPPPVQIDPRLMQAPTRPRSSWSSVFSGGRIMVAVMLVVTLVGGVVLLSTWRANRSEVADLDKQRKRESLIVFIQELTARDLLKHADEIDNRLKHIAQRTKTPHEEARWIFLSVSKGAGRTPIERQLETTDHVCALTSNLGNHILDVAELAGWLTKINPEIDGNRAADIALTTFRFNYKERSTTIPKPYRDVVDKYWVHGRKNDIDFETIVAMMATMSSKGTPVSAFDEVLEATYFPEEVLKRKQTTPRRK
jgi:hypothetical protein